MRIRIGILGRTQVINYFSTVLKVFLHISIDDTGGKLTCGASSSSFTMVFGFADCVGVGRSAALAAFLAYISDSV